MNSPDCSDCKWEGDCPEDVRNQCYKDYDEEQDKIAEDERLWEGKETQDENQRTYGNPDR